LASRGDSAKNCATVRGTDRHIGREIGHNANIRVGLYDCVTSLNSSILL
jgi:hypothetical protein